MKSFEFKDNSVCINKYLYMSIDLFNTLESDFELAEDIEQLVYYKDTQKLYIKYKKEESPLIFNKYIWENGDKYINREFEYKNAITERNNLSWQDQIQEKH